MPLRTREPACAAAGLLTIASWLVPTAALAQQEPPAPPASAAPVATPDDRRRTGSAVEIWFDRESGVTSAWLSNGVLFHHKHLKPPTPADAAAENPARDRAVPKVALCVTIVGAELLESNDNRSISDAAVAAAWTARSVKSKSPAELDALFESSDVSVRGSGGADSFMLMATGEPEKLDAALPGIRLLLTEPVVDPAALATWQERRIKEIREREENGNDAFGGVIASVFGPRDGRSLRPRPEHIRAVTAGQAQAWIDEALGSLAGPDGADGHNGMPMTVAIAGDISVEDAIRMAEKHFASLPPRDRIAPDTLAPHRVATRADRPPEVLPIKEWKGNPLVLIGFFGADLQNVADHRALSVAARIFSTRLDRLPPDQNDGDQASAMAMPSAVFPGFGLFLVATHARPGSEARAGENISRLLDEFMSNGPSQDELSAATNDFISSASRMLVDPTYWARVLSRSVYQGVPLVEIGRATDAYREMRAEAVSVAVRKYFTPERSIRLIVKPAEPEDDRQHTNE